MDSNAPERESEQTNLCPVCDTPADSVSVHDHGLMVNLLDNDRYRRVCFDPFEKDGRPHIRFYHHTHEQVGGTESEPAEFEPSNPNA